MSNDQTYIFVYNADSGKWNGYMDMMHKIVSPKTYPCHLCAITYGIFKIEPAWKSFIETFPIPILFLHKDEWKETSQQHEPLPAIFERRNGALTVLLSAEEMKSMQLDDLKSFLVKSVK
jgi:hypothetical protein